MDTSQDEEFVQAIEVQGSHHFLYTVAEPTKYSLLLSDGSKCFAGHVLKPEETRPAFHNALTTGGGCEFLYVLEPVGKDQARFSWMEQLAVEGMKYKLGETLLRRADDGGPRLLEAAMRIVERRDRSLARLREELDKTRKEQARTLEQLERSVQLKEEMEAELYAKFSLVLNAKKRHIREGAAAGDAAEEQTITSTPASQPASPPASVPNLLDQLLG